MATVGYECILQAHKNDAQTILTNHRKALAKAINTTPQRSFASALAAAQVCEYDADTPPPDSAGRDTQIRWAAQQLESFFLQQMLAGFRRTVPEGGILGERSFATNTYEDMLDAQRAQGMALAGGIGLATLLYEQMKED